MRIDFHTHVFRPAAAKLVIDEMCTRMGMSAAGTGVIDDLRLRLQLARLDSAVLLYAPPKASMIHTANRFVVEQQAAHPDLIAFGSVHPHDKNWQAELDYLRHAGIRGLKLHPEYQDYSLDDPAMLELLRAAAPHFVFLCHMGGLVSDVTSATVRAAPYMLARVLDEVPHMRFIAAHLGGNFLWEDALEHLAGRDVWLDTSASLHAVNESTLHAILQRHDPEKIIFGSDYPFWDPSVEARRLERLTSSDTLDKILSNGAKILDM